MEYCCICSRKIIDRNGKTHFGNNPWGALTPNGELIKWDEEARCCDECNEKRVIPGRLYIMLNKNGLQK